MAVFELVQSLKLISRQIWVTENLWYFHTVCLIFSLRCKLASWVFNQRVIELMQQFLIFDKSDISFPKMANSPFLITNDAFLRDTNFFIFFFLGQFWPATRSLKALKSPEFFNRNPDPLHLPPHWWYSPWSHSRLLYCHQYLELRTQL